MKKLLLGFCIIVSMPSSSQTTASPSEIENKYDFVEIWGLKNQSRHTFLTKIISCPGGICESSLKQMGYEHGNKIPLPFTNKIIVTLRSIPDYSNFPIYKELLQTIKHDKDSLWKKIAHEINELGNYEKQQLPQYLVAFETNNQQKIDSLFAENEKEFKEYGISLDKNKIIESLKAYRSFTKLFTKQEVLAILYLSDVDSLINAASFIAPNYLRTTNDLVDFLPLLLRKKSGVQAIINEFIKENKGKIDWKKNMYLLTNLLKNPNPFQSILALKIADQTGFDHTLMNALKPTDFITIKEILQSNSLPEEKKYILAFLNKYSNKSIEMDPEKWIRKL
ncbi:MAG: hypothetical protein ACKVOW_06420 [Chitinophagaceae bacterium]